MNKEIWKDIDGYEGLYQVSNLGRIKSLPKFHKTNTTGYMQEEKILKPQKDIHGYLKVGLYKNGKCKIFNIHNLVANAFIENPNNYKYVNHKDENKTNNRVENLEFCSFYYNLMYGTRLQRIAKKNNKPILQFDLEGNFIKEYESITQASKELNNSLNNISQCCLGRSRTSKGYIFRFKDDKEILQKYKGIIGDDR